MKVKINPALGERLYEARKLKGITAKIAADQVGVSPQAISLYENNQVTPQPVVFEKLVNLYDMPLEFYLKAPVSNFNCSTVFYRKFGRATKTAREKAFIESKHVVQWIVETIMAKVKFPDVDPLFMEIKESLTVNRKPLDVETMARWIRKKWHLGYGPLNNLILELEKRGVIIILMDFSDDIDGFSYWANNRPYIFANLNNNFFRLRMSIAHELCHLFFHDGIDLQSNLETIEKEAKNFASAFLAPNISFIEDVSSTSLQGLLSLKGKWKMSVAALVLRCEKLNLISEDRALYLNKQISLKRWRKQEPFDNAFPPDRPILLKQSVDLLLQRKVFTTFSFKKEITLPQSFIETACCLPKGFLDDRIRLVQ